MERVEGLLKNLKLSEAEMAGLRIDEKQMEIADGFGKEAVEPKVLVKVLSERLASVEGLKQSLGPIWCPIRGIKCSRRGENIFLITLLQQSGKKKALDCGPWMFNNDLVVVEEYDPDKSVEEYLFNSVPIWIRVLKLPLGKMNKATGEMIGEKVGVWLEADVGEDDLASGEFLRIKVRIDINKPLMRGLMVQVGEEGRNKWCPFEYEFLPEFCYNCGIIGHEENCCPVPGRKGEGKQFGSWLRAYIPKKQNSAERQRWSSGGGSGSGNRSYGFGERKGGAGSNSLSWRKEDSNKSGSATEKGRNSDKEEEVTRPMKNVVKEKNENIPAGSKKALDWAAMVELEEKEQEQVVQVPLAVEKALEAAGKVVEANNTHRRAGKSPAENANKEKVKGITFKRRNRTTKGSDEIVGVKLGAKRNPDQMEVDREEGQMSKKGRTEEIKATPTKAGLSEQPCRSQ